LRKKIGNQKGWVKKATRGGDGKKRRWGKRECSECGVEKQKPANQIFQSISGKKGGE